MNAPANTLYSREILRLATALPHNDHLELPDGAASRRAPICGSEVTAEVALANGRIIAVAFRAHACALGQASAALLRDHALGLDSSALMTARAALEAFLGGANAAALPWDALRHFAPAQNHSARHGAILLPYDALLAAIEDVNARGA